MKPHIKVIYSAIGLLALTSAAFARPIMTPPSPGPGKVYVGVFGGGGSTSSFDVKQYGTAFYSEALGGPLAVNAFGHVNSHSSWFAGGQLGYQAQERMFSPDGLWTMAPAAELEGYYIDKSSFTGHLINNTARLPEHDFHVTYPIERSVFLVNAVLNFNRADLFIHPYIGLGIGSGIVNISGADATQVSPPEAGVNHYNGNASDRDTTFAAQIKLGLSYDINPCVAIFAEYRWLHLSNTHFVFGSTVFPGHPETASWQVNLDPQNFNAGDVGIRFNI